MNQPYTCVAGEPVTSLLLFSARLPRISCFNPDAASDAVACPPPAGEAA